MTKKSARRHADSDPAPVTDESVSAAAEPACPMPVNLSAIAMASLGKPAITGATDVLTGVKIELTASCDPVTDGATLTWEGVGFDLYDATNGGLTGDQDHDAVINLTFGDAGSYKVKAGYSDIAADNSPQYSEEHSITVSAPEPEPEPPADEGEDEFPKGSKVGSEAASIAKVFTEQYRPIAVKAVAGDSNSFDVTRPADSTQPTPNDGEMDWLLKWLSFHFTGQITDARDSGYFRLTLDSKDARVVPGGGATPSKVVKA